MAEAPARCLGPLATDAGAAKGIALDLGQRPLDVRDTGRIVFLLLLQGEYVAVLDPGGFLQALD